MSAIKSIPALRTAITYTENQLAIESDPIVLQGLLINLETLKTKLSKAQAKREALINQTKSRLNSQLAEDDLAFFLMFE